MVFAISAQNLSLYYDKKKIINNFSVDVCTGKIISIIGPNGSGKSTLLKSFARLLKSSSGKILLFGKDICSLSKKDFACRISILLQHNIAPEDITVKRLILLGRSPHKKWYESIEKNNDKILNDVLEKTYLKELAEKKVCELSGGERQRVWLAMALAQQPDVLLLDEPTTYLDIGYQFELLELIYNLNKTTNISIVMVLHDLNQAAQYSDEVLVLKNGCLFKYGTPKEIFTEELITEIYNIKCKIIYEKETGLPIIIAKKNREFSKLAQ